ncbi:hypothetical protein EBME_0157 [bacterium endosymbiont of Mortierella elongata FMR23-6]|nr:hypothetical protein EBME_0157 [bacterium endosymbiont of Mortierella elongata FMR23-6]
MGKPCGELESKRSKPSGLLLGPGTETEYIQRLGGQDT